MNIAAILCFLLAGVLFALATVNVTSERINLSAAGLLFLTAGLFFALRLIP